MLQPFCCGQPMAKTENGEWECRICDGKQGEDDKKIPPTEENPEQYDIDVALLEKIINATFPGLTMYVRDVNLPDALADKYTAGMIIREPAFCDASSRVMGMITTHRYAILSNHMADFSSFEHGTNWGLHVAQRNSYFKVLGSHAHNGKKIIILLHLQEGTWEIFQNMSSNIEDQARDSTIERFINKCDMEPIPELAAEAWLARCSAPLGMDDNGEFYAL